MKSYNCKFIITGDIEQIGPICEPKINLRNGFFKAIFKNVTTLTKDYRNDKGLIKLREMVLSRGTDDLEQYFKANESGDISEVKRALCYTHNSRRYINQMILNKNEYVYEHCDGWLNVSPGVILGCRITLKDQELYKNDIWEVLKCDENILTIYNINKGVTKELEQKYAYLFTVSFATTTHASQGLTIKDEFVIYDIDMMLKNDKSILYVAITRGTNKNNIKFKCTKAYGGEEDLNLITYDKSESKKLDVDVCEMDEIRAI